MLKIKCLLLVLCPFLVKSQVYFNRDRQIFSSDRNYSKVPNAVIDINGDYLDDIIVLDDGKRLKAYFQTQEEGVYFSQDYGVVSGSGQFALAAADLDNDGWKEIFVGGLYDGVKIYKSFDNTSKYLQWQKTASNFYTQNISFVDYNMDACLDLHINDDDNFPKFYENDCLGQLTLADPFNYEVSGEKASGNYGSLWTDFDDDGDQDLYISKCRLGVSDANDLRRINQLWINQGDESFIEEASNFNLDIGEQTWVSDFVDLDNDGDKDLVMLNHTDANYIFENIGGVFVKRDISEAWEELFEGLQLIARDFDNDGFKDIMIAGFESKLFWNKGDFEFEEDPIFLNGQTALTFSVGDLNEDGFWDIYAGFANGITESNRFVEDQIWLNEGNANNFLKVSLKGLTSNRDGVGASSKIYGAWGVQSLDVRSGESYGVNNSQALLFGLGTEERYDSLVITWPSGVRQVVNELEINKHHIVQENGCTSNLLDIKVKEDLILCSNEESVFLSAPESTTYAWSNGDQNRDIEVDQAGFYCLSVTNENGCSYNAKPILVRDQAGISKPMIQVQDPKRLYCYDDVIKLKTQYEEVKWGIGDIGKTYTGLAQDTILASLEICGDITSEPFIPEIPQFDGLRSREDTLDKGEDAVFEMDGLLVNWYTDSESEFPISTSESVTIENLEQDTSLYASIEQRFLGLDSLLVRGDIKSFQNPNENINGSLIFSVDEYSSLLKSVKCFSDTAAIRKIQVKDVWGEIVHEKEVFIGPQDSIAELNFALSKSNYYQLTTDRNTNIANLGTRSPQLRLSVFESSIIGQKSVNGNVQIQASSGGSNELYSFNDLIFVDYDFDCESKRVKISKKIRRTSTTSDLSKGDIFVYPNPFRNEVHFSNDFSDEDYFHLFSLEGKLMKSGWVKGGLSGELLPSGIYFLRIKGEFIKLIRE